ncbi:class E sortase [Amnibacterium sp.]|uniref:class E sortase n=1 Tax=Amnibacterium sp. TaxID=1872496 RepID=UPI002602F546|nr:class E sortase [Amnibacterium sp.]MCU1474874.1 class sortase [Amnibacterium sp.]
MTGGGKRRGKGWLLTSAGVVLIGLGLAVAGSVGWQTVVVSPLAASAQERAAAAQSKGWSAVSSRPPPSGRGGGQGIPVQGEPRLGRTVAVVVIPRFGATWRRVIREGVDEPTILNSFNAGVGHYPGTAMPGAVGNFAIAAHDTGYGDAFRDVGKLRLDDLIYIQTEDGWYTYRFRNFQWVQPSEVGVIQPVPEQEGTAPTARLITLTTCDPPYNAQEREIAYGTLVHFQAGPGPRPNVGG